MVLLSARDLNIAQRGHAVHIPIEYLIKRAKLHAWNVCEIFKAFNLYPSTEASSASFAQSLCEF